MHTVHARGCTVDACPVAVGPEYAMDCRADRLCARPGQLDFEIQLMNPAAIPPAGIHSEFVITAGFFTDVASGGGGFGQPQPVGADLSDVTIDINCVPSGQ